MTREEVLNSPEYWEEKLQNILALEASKLVQQSSEEEVKKTLELSNTGLDNLIQGEARTLSIFVKVMMKTHSDKFIAFVKSVEA